jgi:hypothetical protein
VVVYRSQWPRGLRRGSAAARLTGLWVRIPPTAWTFVSCECCMLPGRCLCDGLITRPGHSYRLWCLIVFDLVMLWRRRPWAALGRSAKGAGRGERCPVVQTTRLNIQHFAFYPHTVRVLHDSHNIQTPYYPKNMFCIHNRKYFWSMCVTKLNFFKYNVP